MKDSVSASHWNAINSIATARKTSMIRAEKVDDGATRWLLRDGHKVLIVIQGSSSEFFSNFAHEALAGVDEVRRIERTE